MGKLASDNRKLVYPFRQERRQSAKVQGEMPSETAERDKAFSDFFFYGKIPRGAKRRTT